MLHISQLHKLVEHGEFSLNFVSTDGQNVHVQRCICSSFHSSGRTMNIKFCDSEEIRTVRRCTVTSFNREEVVL
jgi:hypothetical protein